MSQPTHFIFDSGFDILMVRAEHISDREGKKMSCSKDDGCPQASVEQSQSSKGMDIKNICFVGAGHVGKFDLYRISDSDTRSGVWKMKKRHQTDKLISSFPPSHQVRPLPPS